MASGNPLAAAFGVILRSLGSLLAGIYAIIPSYAVAIALLTVIVRLVLWPLTAKQTRSMAAMNKLQPEIKELKNKYKDDRAKLQEETMALYRERKVNPFGGCLPLLIQGPILFTLWRVLGVAWGATRFKPFSGAVTDFCANELGQPSQCVTGTAFIPPRSALFTAIQGRNVHFLGIDLTKPGSGQQGIGVVMFIVLIAAVAGTMWYQQKQMQRRTGVINPQMQAVTQIMPLGFGLLTYNLAGGLGIYFIVGNLFQISQQAIMLNRIDNEEPDAEPAKQRRGLLSGLREQQAEKVAAGTSSKSAGKVAATSGNGQKSAARSAGRTRAGGKATPVGAEGRSKAGAKASGGGGSAAVAKGPSRNRSKKKRKKKGR